MAERSLDIQQRQIILDIPPRGDGVTRLHCILTHQLDGSSWIIMERLGPFWNIFTNLGTFRNNFAPFGTFLTIVGHSGTLWVARIQFVISWNNLDDFVF